MGSAAPARQSRASETGLRSDRFDMSERKGAEILLTVAVVLLVAWLLGLVGAYAIGAFVHLLLIAAVVLFLIGFAKGRRTVV